MPQYLKRVREILTTDASKCHVGTVLSQMQPDGKPGVIDYFPKKLKPAET